MPRDSASCLAASGSLVRTNNFSCEGNSGKRANRCQQTDICLPSRSKNSCKVYILFDIGNDVLPESLYIRSYTNDDKLPIYLELPS